MGGAPEPVQPEALDVGTGEAQGAIADEPAAEERSDLDGRALGECQDEAGVGDRQRREPAVDVAAGEPAVDAEILPPAPAVAAFAVGPCQPRHPDPVADAGPVGDSRADPGDATDDLVAEDPRQSVRVDLAV